MPMSNTGSARRVGAIAALRNALLLAGPIDTPAVHNPSYGKPKLRAIYVYPDSPSGSTNCPRSSNLRMNEALHHSADRNGER